MNIRSAYFRNIVVIVGVLLLVHCQRVAHGEVVKLWTPHEIILHSKQSFENPYSDVTCWITLTGPSFKRRVYGFWDGGDTFKVRVVATSPGEWKWTSSSDVNDVGLNGKQGAFQAEGWTENEKLANPNRRGFLRPTPNGHALQYADGSPFFLLGDTWWAASTWRYPMKHQPVPTNYVPKPDIGFEEAVQFNKRRGYNAIAMIAAFPNWHNDGYPALLRETDGTIIRNCESWKDNRTGSAKDMRDERGNRSFYLPGKAPTLGDVCADFDRINPEYFKSLDAKLEYCRAEGFVLFFETVRRDHIPTWMKYHDFNTSFPRYVNYIAARYGCFNIIFSAAHQDSGRYDLNPAITLWYERYGGMPFGQPVSALAHQSTLQMLGHGDEVPWLNLHGIGCGAPRDNTAILRMEPIFRLADPYPAITQEPYYPGLMSSFHMRGFMEMPPTDSERDQYYARVHAWGGVLSGGLGGHIYGTNAWDGDVAAVEPRQEQWGEGNEYIYEALQFQSAGQMVHLRTFIMSESAHLHHLELAVEDMSPRASTPDAKGHSMSGLGFMLRTPDKSMAMLYFEDCCKSPLLKNMQPDETYSIVWFNPRTGEWSGTGTIQTDNMGELQLPGFPGGLTVTPENEDWALKIVAR